MQAEGGGNGDSERAKTDVPKEALKKLVRKEVARGQETQLATMKSRQDEASRALETQLNTLRSDMSNMQLQSSQELVTQQLLASVRCQMQEEASKELAMQLAAVRCQMEEEASKDLTAAMKAMGKQQEERAKEEREMAKSERQWWKREQEQLKGEIKRLEARLDTIMMLVASRSQDQVRCHHCLGCLRDKERTLALHLQGHSQASSSPKCPAYEAPKTPLEQFLASLGLEYVPLTAPHSIATAPHSTVYRITQPLISAGTLLSCWRRTGWRLRPSRSCQRRSRHKQHTDTGNTHSHLLLCCLR
jgi:hypothetical protein